MPRTAVLYSILRPSVPVRARSAPYGFFSFVGILPPYSESFVPFSPQRFCTKISVISLPFSSESVRHLSFRFIQEGSLSFFPFHSGKFAIFLPVSFGNVRYPYFLSAVSAPVNFPCSILPSSAVLRTEAKARSAKARYRSFLSRIFSGNGARIPKLAFMG